jgi:hypothetical protein
MKYQRYNNDLDDDEDKEIVVKKYNSKYKNININKHKNKIGYRE